MTPSLTSVAFLAGMIAMGHLVAGVFFLRFWKRTGDLLFLVFAAAFWMLGLNQGLVGLSGAPPEEQGIYYLLRLTGFILIIVAIAAKNIRHGGKP